MGGNIRPDPPVFFLMGPTATGKTQLTVELAEWFPVDVISVDAGQIYRGMDIGTAKPSSDILERVPHRLIDICSPWARYSAGQFRRDALVEIKRSMQLGRIPLLVGGTAFYFRALESGLSRLPERSEKISQELSAEAAANGWSSLYDKLREIDAESAHQISPNDHQRIIRLLEMYHLSGLPPSQIRRHHPAEPPAFRIIKLAIARSDRDVHHEQIRQRFFQMLDRGFLAEAERLFRSKPFDASLPAMRCVGYQQAYRYFAGQIDHQQMVQEVIRDTRGIAKRQLTWIRNQAGVIWSMYRSALPTVALVRLMNAMLASDDCGVTSSDF